MRIISILLLLFTTFSVSASTEKVVLQLKWKHQFQFAGYYAAQKEGYFTDAGFDVDIREAGKDIYALPEVASGKAQFGVALPDILLHQKLNQNVQIVVPIFQHSPLVLVTKKDHAGKSVSCLKGKKIMLRDSESYEIMAMLKRAGVDSSNSTLLPLSWDWNDLVTGNVDAYTLYLSDLPIFLSQHDSLEFNVFTPIDYNVDFYGDCLIVNKKYARKNRSRVAAFRDAVTKGWEYALDNPEDVIAYIQEHFPSTFSNEELLAEANEIKKLMVFGYVDIGNSAHYRWEHIVDVYKDLSILPDTYRFDTTMIFSEGSLFAFSRLTFGIVLLLVAVVVIILYFNYLLRLEIDRKVKELRKSEELFRTIFDNSNQLITVLDREGKVQIVNQISMEMIGVSEDEVIGIEFWTTPWWRHSSKMQSELKNHILSMTRGKSFQTQASHVDSEGKVHVVDFTLIPIENSDNEIEYIIAVGYDMSHIHEIEERDRHLQKMEAIGTLAGGIAHDFNNILAGIFGYLDLASLEEHDNENLHEAHNEIRSAADRAKELVSQILTFSRQGSVEREPMKLADTVQEAMKLIRSSIPSSISIDLRLRSDDFILANSTQMHQVIMNMCTNAYHAMQAQKSGLLSVSIDTVEWTPELGEEHPGLPKGEYLELTIRDTGCGMDSDTTAQVFNPYFTTKVVGKGTGLGLSLVHSIITSHDGVITVSSKPGVGTAFTMLFPVIDYTEEEIIEESTQMSEIEHNEIHIMFVDDEEMIVKSATRFLEREGFVVDSFLDSTEVLSYFEEYPEKFSVVITDMTMPLLNGVELLEEISAIRNDVPMVLCSGFNTREKELSEQLPQINRFLQKPIAMKDLVAVVREIVRANDNG